MVSFGTSARPRRRNTLALKSLLATACVFAGLTPGTAHALDPLALYRGGLDFEIRRDGRPVGTHRVEFSPRADAVTVNARSEIAVPFLGFVAYRFTYDSSSEWRSGILESLDARTDDDGDKSFAQAKLRNGQLAIQGSSGTQSAPVGTFSTDHWHGGVRGAGLVLNTITGALNKVTMTREGVDMVETGTGTREAERWRYAGGLDTIVWYDREGRWVRLQFAARDGSVITYVCRSCGPDEVAMERGGPGDTPRHGK